MAKKLKVWNGASWEDVTFAITPPTTSVTNSFTTNQVIDASTSVSALRITQRGTGYALTVEDDTNPDSSPFVIDASGSVGIGTGTPQQKLSVTGNIHMNGGSGTGISWAADQSSHYLKFDSGLNGIKLQGYSNIVFETLNQQERMRINSSGNVSIGTATEDGRLYISSPNPTTELHIQAYSDPSKKMTIQADNNVLRFISRWTGGTGGYIVWSTGQPVSDRMWLTDTGQFYIVAAQDINAWRIRNTYASTSAPSGGNDGDMWAVYV